MRKYDPEVIEEQARVTRTTYHGRPGSHLAKQLKIWEIRNYVDKTLFLCKELKKAKAKNLPK